MVEKIEEKRLEKLNKIFEEIEKDHFKPHPELREALFENGVPICTGCGKLMVQEESGLWKCDNPECKRDKNIRWSVG